MKPKLTVNQLYKKLGKLIRDGYGRKRVCIDKPSFTHPLESDGVVYINAEEVGVESLLVMNDDGGTLHGDREIYRTNVVLYGPDEKSKDTHRREMEECEARMKAGVK